MACYYGKSEKGASETQEYDNPEDLPIGSSIDGTKMTWELADDSECEESKFPDSEDDEDGTSSHNYKFSSKKIRFPDELDEPTDIGARKSSLYECLCKKWIKK